mmetsp:Transcript_134/g.396  ORF Transcript_134/g.396 Transcript_134/m.396 type:complete len:477 (+) Transcript_134:58-1488(+)
MPVLLGQLAPLLIACAPTLLGAAGCQVLEEVVEGNLLLQQQQLRRKEWKNETEEPVDVNDVIKRFKLPAVEPLWTHLAKYVVPSRVPLGELGNLEVMSVKDGPKELGDVAALQNAFAEAVLTAGVTLVSPEQEPATRFSLVPGCALHDGLATWNTLPAGAVLILPVCTTASLEPTVSLSLLKRLNCKLRRSTLENCPSLQESCSQLPAPDLLALAFIEGFLILEKGAPFNSDLDGQVVLTQLAAPVEHRTSTGVRLLDRYAHNTNGTNNTLLVIGDVCQKFDEVRSATDMALFWRTLFPNMSYEFVETNQSCSLTAHDVASKLNISMKMAGAYARTIGSLAVSMNSPGIEVVVDALDSLPEDVEPSTALAVTVADLWSSMSYSGIYLVEDPLTVKPSDCEVTAPEPHRAARYVLELGEAVVRRSGHLEIDRIECQQNSCLLQKVNQSRFANNNQDGSSKGVIAGAIRSIAEALKAG